MNEVVHKTMESLIKCEWMCTRASGNLIGVRRDKCEWKQCTLSNAFAECLLDVIKSELLFHTRCAIFPPHHHNYYCAAPGDVSGSHNLETNVCQRYVFISIDKLV